MYIIHFECPPFDVLFSSFQTAIIFYIKRSFYYVITSLKLSLNHAGFRVVFWIQISTRITDGVSFFIALTLLANYKQFTCQPDSHTFTTCHPLKGPLISNKLNWSLSQPCFNWFFMYYSSLLCFFLSCSHNNLCAKNLNFYMQILYLQTTVFSFKSFRIVGLK